MKTDSVDTRSRPQKIFGDATSTRFYFAVTIVVVVCVLIRVKYAFARVWIPFEIEYGEGSILNAAAMLLHGRAIYPDPHSFPSILNPYGPVGYFLTGLGIKLFGLSFFGPRLLVLFGCLGICFFIAALIKQLGGRWQIGFLMGSLYLCLPVVWFWLPLLRVDFWAVCLSVAGLYIFSRYSSLWFLASLIFVLALLTKPTSIAAAFSCFVYLVAEKRFKQALGFAAILTTGLLACVGFLGPNFVFASIRTHPDLYSIKQVVKMYFEVFQGVSFALLATACCVAIGYRWTNRSRLAWLYLAASSLTALTAGKLGSNSNHFLEWPAAVCIVCGLALSDLADKHSPFERPFVFACVATMVALVVVFISTPGAKGIGCQEEYAYVHSFRGDRILSEDVGALVLNGKPVLVLDPFIVTQLGTSVAWSWGGIEKLVRDRYFDMILFGQELKEVRPEWGRWSPETIRLVGERYKEDRKFPCGVAYVRDPTR